MKTLQSALLLAFTVSMSRSAIADDAPPREQMDEAWWVGPLLSIPSVTIPEGSSAMGLALLDQVTHMGHEVVDVPEPGLNEAEFRSAFIYGVSDDFNLGLWPVVGLGQ